MLEASKFADGAYRTGAKLLLAATAMAASMLTLAGGAQAGSVTYSGVLTDTPTYHRPSYTNAFTPAFNCTNCGFQSEAVSVSLSGAYTFSILSSSFPDQVNMLYTDSFDPGSPFTNLVSPYSHATYQSGNATTLSLASGVQYYWVTSSDYGYPHNNCALGCDFTTKISGPGEIVAGVPEPSVWGMMLIGFGGMGAALRSRRWAAPTAA